MYMIRISMNIKAYYLSIKQNMQYNRKLLFQETKIWVQYIDVLFTCSDTSTHFKKIFNFYMILSY